MQELERRTGGREPLLPGSPYTTTAHMVDEGLNHKVTPARSESAKRHRDSNGPASARQVVRAEIAHLQELVGVADDQRLTTESR